MSGGVADVEREQHPSALLHQLARDHAAAPAGGVDDECAGGVEVHRHPGDVVHANAAPQRVAHRAPALADGREALLLQAGPPPVELVQQGREEDAARIVESVIREFGDYNTLVNNAMLRWGTEDQKSRYLPKLAKDTVGAYALSEPDSGSDAFALAFRAVAEGDFFRLTGTKLWITNGNEAGVFIVFATVDPELGYKGITAFLVERDFEGVTVGKKEDKLGIRASSTTELILSRARVPRSNVLGDVCKGYKIAIETLN